MWIQKVPGGGVLALCYSPDGGTLYTKDGGGWVSAWDTASHTGRRLFRAHHRYYGGFGLAGNGRHLVSVGDIVYALDTTTGDVHTLAVEGLTHERVITDAIHLDPLSPRLLVLTRGSPNLATWNLEAWRAGPNLEGWNTLVDFGTLTVTPLGRVTARIAEDAVFVSLDMFSATRSDYHWPDVPNLPHSAVPSPDGRCILFFAGHEIYIWNLAHDDYSSVASYLPGTITAFHPTAPVFAALNQDKALTLFSLETGEPIQSLDFGLGVQVQCVGFAPDGLTCAVGGSNKQFAVFDVDL